MSDTLYMLNKEMADAYQSTIMSTCDVCGDVRGPLHETYKGAVIRYRGMKLMFDDSAWLCGSCYLRARLEGQL